MTFIIIYFGIFGVAFLLACLSVIAISGNKTEEETHKLLDKTFVWILTMIIVGILSLTLEETKKQHDRIKQLEQQIMVDDKETK